MNREERLISIHALREEGDVVVVVVGTVEKLFLSTPSARRATAASCKFFVVLLFLSTPSARRATVAFGYFIIPLGISIHALREEGDR